LRQGPACCCVPKSRGCPGLKCCGKLGGIRECLAAAAAAAAAGAGAGAGAAAS